MSYDIINNNEFMFLVSYSNHWTWSPQESHKRNGSHGSLVLGYATARSISSLKEQMVGGGGKISDSWFMIYPYGLLQQSGRQLGSLHLQYSIPMPQAAEKRARAWWRMITMLYFWFRFIISPYSWGYQGERHDTMLGMNGYIPIHQKFMLLIMHVSPENISHN